MSTALQPRTPPSTLPSRRRRLTRTVGLRRWAIGVAGALCLAGGAWALWGSGPYSGRAMPVTLVRAGKVDVAYAVDGLIIRHESTQAAPISGQFKPEVAEGQRVRVGTGLAWVLPTVATTADNATAPRSAAETSRLAALRNQYNEMTQQVYDTAVAEQGASARGDTVSASQLHATLQALGRQQSSVAQAIGALEANQSPTSLPGSEIIATRAGIVSFRLDGLEELDPQRSRDWDVAWFDSRTAELPQLTADQVQANQDVVKIVDNLGVSLAFLLPEAAKAKLQAEMQVTLTGMDGQPPLTVHLAQVSAPQGGKILVVVEADTLPESLVAVRRTSLSLVTASYSGRIVPRRSVGEQNGQPGVWVLRQQRPTFVPVRIDGGNETDVVVAGSIQAGDSVLLSPPS